MICSDNSSRQNPAFDFNSLKSQKRRQDRMRETVVRQTIIFQKWNTFYPNLPRNSALRYKQSRISKSTQEFPHNNNQIDYVKSSYKNAFSPRLNIESGHPLQNLSTLPKLLTTIETSTSPLVPDPHSSKLFTINLTSTFQIIKTCLPLY